MTRFEYANQIEEILDDALNQLAPDVFKILLERIAEMLEDYEE